MQANVHTTMLRTMSMFSAFFARNPQQEESQREMPN